MDATVVEQRIVEQAARLPDDGAVTGWASLRWRGATFFDGTTAGGTELLPVPLLIGINRNLRPHPGSTVSREFAHDMAMAARMISMRLFATYVEQRSSWIGVPLVRDAMLLGSEHRRSPQEVRMAMAWEIDAGLPRPLYNVPVFSRDGRFLGIPDLLDPVAGGIGEYDGEDHRDQDRHQRDVQREQRFRDHGLEYFTVVGGELGDRDMVVERMMATRRRCRFLPPEARAWTLTPPSWWEPEESLDDYLVRLGLAGQLTHI